MPGTMEEFQQHFGQPNPDTAASLDRGAQDAANAVNSVKSALAYKNPRPQPPVPEDNLRVPWDKPAGQSSGVRVIKNGRG